MVWGPIGEGFVRIQVLWLTWNAMCTLYGARDRAGDALDVRHIISWGCHRETPVAGGDAKSLTGSRHRRMLCQFVVTDSRGLLDTRPTSGEGSFRAQ